MEEPTVVTAVRRYLSNGGWHLLNVITGKIGNNEFRPDIFAHKKGKNLSVECKGSVELDEILRGIGQCIEHQYYGSDIVYFAVPEDKKEVAKLLLKNIIILGGKIGLLVVKRNREVYIEIKPKELKLTKELKRSGKQRRQKLAFVRDLRIEELGKILEFASQHKQEYKNKMELATLLLKNKKKIFTKRKSVSIKSSLNALITPTNLGLMDNLGNLTDEGEALRESYENNISHYKDDLSAYLLINGNWLELLRTIEEGKLKANGDVDKLANLLEKYELVDEDMNKFDYAKRVNSQYFKWLKELGIIKIENNILKVDWVAATKSLSGKINLNM